MSAPTDRTRLFNAHRDDLRSQGAVFYSGFNNLGFARKLSKSGGGTTIEDTAGGKAVFGTPRKAWGDERTWSTPLSRTPSEEMKGTFDAAARGPDLAKARAADAVNRAASGTFAGLAKGDAKARTCGAPRNGAYRRAELPTMLVGCGPASVEGVNMRDLRRMYRSERDKGATPEAGAQKGLDRVHRRICVAALRNMSREARRTGDPAKIVEKVHSMQAYKRQMAQERAVPEANRARLYDGIATKEEWRLKAETRLAVERQLSKARLEGRIRSEGVGRADATRMRADNATIFDKRAAELRGAHAASAHERRLDRARDPGVARSGSPPSPGEQPGKAEAGLSRSALSARPPTAVRPEGPVPVAQGDTARDGGTDASTLSDADYFARSVDDPGGYPPRTSEMGRMAEERRRSEQTSASLREARGEGAELSERGRERQMADRVSSYDAIGKGHAVT